MHASNNIMCIWIPIETHSTPMTHGNHIKQTHPWSSSIEQAFSHFQEIAQVHVQSKVPRNYNALTNIGILVNYQIAVSYKHGWMRVTAELRSGPSFLLQPSSKSQSIVDSSSHHITSLPCSSMSLKLILTTTLVCSVSYGVDWKVSWF